MKKDKSTVLWTYPLISKITLVHVYVDLKCLFNIKSFRYLSINPANFQKISPQYCGLKYHFAI